MKTFILFLFCSSISFADSKIGLVIGEQSFLKTSPHESITVSNPKVLFVKKEATRILLVGKKQGLSYVSFQKSKKIMAVNVYPTNFSELFHEIKRLNQDIDFIYLNKKVAIKASPLRLSDWIILGQLQKQFPDQLELQIKANLEILEQAKSKIVENLKSQALTATRVEIQNSKLQIVTQLSDKNSTQQIAQLGAQWGAPVIINGAGVELKPMVEVEITIAEVKKSNMRSLGLKLPGQYSATVIPSANFDSIEKKFDPIGIQFNAQNEMQVGKVIANPKLLCRSGESAHFIAGGEIPIKIMNWKTSDVVWKRYGVILDITPKADIQKNISTKIMTEISLLDEAHKVDGIPGLLTNRVETHFDIKGEKTIALSGLIKNEIGRGSSGPSLLSEIPIIGELFKSNDYKDNKTELIVFVTPRLIRPDDAPKKIKNQFWMEND